MTREASAPRGGDVVRARRAVWGGSLLIGVLAISVLGCATQSTPDAPASGIFGPTLCVNARPRPDHGVIAHIETWLGAGAVESPSDGHYAPPRAHIQERGPDAQTGPHFAFLAIEPTDVNQDGKTLQQGGDRSRTEIKISPQPGGVYEPFKAREGDTFVYTWRFKIAPDMKFSPVFTHIHQIKASGGEFAAPPLITFTPLANGTMEFRHVGDLQRDSSAMTVLARTPLEPLVGRWVDAVETVHYSNTHGRYALQLRGPDGQLLLELDKAPLSMWRTGATQIHPKWGIYRKHHAMLNQHHDDYVYFAHFGITRGTQPGSNCL